MGIGLTVDALVGSDDSIWQVRCSIIAADCAVCQRSHKIDFIDFLPDVSPSSDLQRDS